MSRIKRCLSTTTHFGYKTVETKDKKPLVAKVFHDVADKYDMMNDAMSAGVHRVWKDSFVDMLGPRPNRPGLPQFRVLDVAGGTGDIAFRIGKELRKHGINELMTLEDSNRPADIVVCDINSSMLRVGQDRAKEMGFTKNLPKIDWIEGDAEKLEFESNSFDAYTIAFGIRNVTQIEKALEEAFRVLRPGGRFMCLEFSHVENPLMRAAYDAFSFNVIPQLGQMIANDRDSYQYLVESIRKFPAQNEFKGMIETVGFSHVRYVNLTGGIAAVHSGFKI